VEAPEQLPELHLDERELAGDSLDVLLQPLFLFTSNFCKENR